MYKLAFDCLLICLNTFLLKCLLKQMLIEVFDWILK